MGTSLLIATVFAIFTAAVIKVYSWVNFCKKVNKNQHFRIYYPKVDIMGTSSPSKKQFMRNSNLFTLIWAGIVLLLLVASYVYEVFFA